MSHIGTIIIGRNEGERLKRCFDSLINSDTYMVYVDSGSNDGSVEYAKSIEVPVVQLDDSVPFSAARARNEGMHFLINKFPGLSYLQFVDGDCVVSSGWIQCASAFLDANNKCAVVCGRRRELHPERSVYNRLCDMEWNTPIGVANSCGGDFIARIDALIDVEGFNPEIVAGEEPELCYRLRRKLYTVHRLNAEMTFHDANMLKFNQWWKRTLRSGHAYAHNMILHWGSAERLNQRKVLSIALWGAFFPLLLTIALLLQSLIVFTVVLVAYLLMALKIAIYQFRKRGFNLSDSIVYGLFTMLGKIPQFIGVITYFVKRSLTKKIEIIEYKS